MCCQTSTGSTIPLRCNHSAVSTQSVAIESSKKPQAQKSPNFGAAQRGDDGLLSIVKLQWPAAVPGGHGVGTDNVGLAHLLLSIVIMAIGSKFVKARGFCKVLRDAHAILIAFAEIEQRIGVSLIGGKLEQSYSLFQVLLDTITGFVADSKIEARIYITLGDGELVELHCLRGVLCNADSMMIAHRQIVLCSTMALTCGQFIQIHSLALVFVNAVGKLVAHRELGLSRCKALSHSHLIQPHCLFFLHQTVIVDVGLEGEVVRGRFLCLQCRQRLVCRCPGRRLATFAKYSRGKVAELLGRRRYQRWLLVLNQGQQREDSA
eukprot:m.170249 g.170249  ORF g.170249 m.170249 type:complete len:320 (-) comp10376_c0_seq5:462-1421(-)